jgi:hypothetical protein
MSKRVAVAAESLSTEQSNAFTNWVEAKGFGYWHWIDGFWLIVSPSGQIDLQVVAEKLNELSPSSNNLVLEVPQPSGWYGYGPKSEQKNMFTWLKETWDK